jgi:hypothetical protein
MLATGEKIKKVGPGKATPAASPAPSTPVKGCTDEVSTVSDILQLSNCPHFNNSIFTAVPGFR